MKSEKPFLLAIEGRCGAGKTTMAERIRAKSGCAVIPMDHFFLRPDMRSEERLREPGGNVDYERFQEEVLVPLEEGRPFSYRPFSCRIQAFAKPICITPGRLVVIEGSYSCHPRLFPYYDLSLFLDIDFQEQLRRIEKRNGRDGLADFQEKWIPLEERYFRECGIAEKCSLYIHTESSFPAGSLERA